MPLKVLLITAAQSIDAESHYDDTDKPWEQHKGLIAIDGHPITSNVKQALERNVRTRISIEFLSKRCAQAPKQVTQLNWTHTS